MRACPLLSISAVLFASAILSRPLAAQDATASEGTAATAPAADPTRPISGTITPPSVVHRVDPEFSPEARATMFNGNVLVGLTVDTNGLPQNVHVEVGAGMGLDDKAIEAVKQYVFKPAMEDGKPVAVPLSVEVSFEISRSPTVIYTTPLKLTSEARKNKASGVILVGLIIDEKGRPQNVHVVRGFGMGMDEQAVEAVKRYKFLPYTLGGKPVAHPVNLKVRFDAR